MNFELTIYAGDLFSMTVLNAENSLKDSSFSHLPPVNVCDSLLNNIKIN